MKRNIFRTILAVVLVCMVSFVFFGCTTDDQKTTKKTHDQETHVVTNSEKTAYHNFVDGKCTMCDETTIFRQDPMLKSPEILTTAQSEQGTLEYFWYKTRAYGVEEKIANGSISCPEAEGQELWIYKRAYVYLPHGYDKNDATKKYNVLYMMHGNKLNEGYWFGQGSYLTDRSAYTGGYGTENVIDYLYQNKLMEDTIFVSMTMYQYYNGEYSGDDANPNYVGGDAAQGNVYSGYVDPENDIGVRVGVGEANEGTDTVYYKEWFNHLMPYVVTHYNTYAKSTSEEDLIAARDHVGYTGLSRGGQSMASVLKNCIKYCSYYGSESSWLPDDAAIKVMKENENTYPVNYFFISCGSQEGVDSCDASCLKLKKELGWAEGSDIKNGDRVAFIQVNGTAHNYATWITNLYNCMLVFFKR